MWPFLLEGLVGRLCIIKNHVPNNVGPITMPIYLTEWMIVFAEIEMTQLIFFVWIS